MYAVISKCQQLYKDYLYIILTKITFLLSVYIDMGLVTNALITLTVVTSEDSIARIEIIRKKMNRSNLIVKSSGINVHHKISVAKLAIVPGAILIFPI